MRVTLLSLLVVSLLAVPGAARAQSVDPSGHWEGAITIPGGEIPFQVDLSKNAQGKLLATYSRPEENLKGLPMNHVTLDGRAIFVRFIISDVTPTSCHFEQACSADGGKTWETNWIATDTRVAAESGDAR